MNANMHMIIINKPCKSPLLRIFYAYLNLFHLRIIASPEFNFFRVPNFIEFKVYLYEPSLIFSAIHI